MTFCKTFDQLSPLRIRALVNVVEGKGEAEPIDRLTGLVSLGLLKNNDGSYSPVEGLDSALDTWLNENPGMMRLLFPQ
jgi:hypothetical protein